MKKACKVFNNHVNCFLAMEPNISYFDLMWDPYYPPLLTPTKYFPLLCKVLYIPLAKIVCKNHWIGNTILFSLNIYYDGTALGPCNIPNGICQSLHLSLTLCPFSLSTPALCKSSYRVQYFLNLLNKRKKVYELDLSMCVLQFIIITIITNTTM